MRHDPRCDRDLCHPDCPVRRRAEEDDVPFPGSPRTYPAWPWWYPGRPS